MLKAIGNYAKEQTKNIYGHWLAVNLWRLAKEIMLGERERVREKLKK